MTTIMLVDNGSKRADATLALRRLSRALAADLGVPVHPVSLAHSSKVPAAALDGTPADTLEPFLLRQAEQGARDFLAVPLFFGPSRALTKLIPEIVEQLNARDYSLQLRVAEPLCPLPAGEPRLAAILDRAIRDSLARFQTPGPSAPVALLVDHGSPIPEVTAVRNWLAARLESLSQGEYRIIEAAMERRPGPEYAFNGLLLEEALERIASEQGTTRLVIAMQFIGPGRHAGRGGDVETICRQAQSRHPGLDIAISRLVGEDDGLIAILADRARA
jgi:sirohydrochlorin ferrochelatase